MKSKFIQHKNVNHELLLEIIKVKSVAWKYSVEEHLNWINNNIVGEDIHVLLLNDEDEIIAYLNLISIKFSINKIESQGFGIGNVCALNKGDGNGAKLIHSTNNFLINKHKIGVLFCKDQLVSFYKKLNWIIVPKSNIYIKENLPDINTLVFNFKPYISKLEYNNKLF